MNIFSALLLLVVFNNCGEDTSKKVDNQEVQTENTTTIVPQQTVAPRDLEPEGFQGVLAAHNAYRSNIREQESITTEKMPDLLWSDQLQESAQKWVDRLLSLEKGDCGVSLGRGAHSQINGVGENIYWGSGTPANAVDSWGGEKKDFDEKTGGVTGHYTQIIWANTKYVGCAQGSGCPQYGNIVVCQYSPPGNYIGAEPY